MSRRAVLLEGKHDQMVMFTLVELMTHLIFLALILGFALRKEADPVYQQLTAKCGTDGSQCIAVAKPVIKGARPGGLGLPTCFGRRLLNIRALGDGSFALIPAADLPAAARENPAMARLLVPQTLDRAGLAALGGAARRAANAGALRQGSCQIVVDICRAHSNRARYDGQDYLASLYFNVPRQHACRR